MKTIEHSKTGQLERVDDDMAHNLTLSGVWRYVPKWRWKETQKDS